MKSDEQILELIKQKQFDGVRYASIDRLKLNRMDAQAWAFLGQAMIGLNRGHMAKLCFKRVLLLSPYATWIDRAMQHSDATSYGREDKAVQNLLEVQKVSVTACILTHNNSTTIRQCLDALTDAVDEIVVVDTGSTDDTVKIVTSAGIDVHHFEWCKDFSAARNYAKSLAKSKWIISIDSDEILYNEDRDNIRTIASLLNTDIYLVQILQMNSNQGSLSRIQAARMFPSEHFTWVHPVHEEPRITEHAPVKLPQTIVVHIRVLHTGYDSAYVNTQEKLNRNIDILRSALQQAPNNFAFLYYLGRELSIAEKHDEALVLLEKSYFSAIEGTPALPEIVERIARTYIQLGKIEEASLWLERIVEDRPEHPNGWFLLGILLKDKDLNKAKAYLRKAKEVGLKYGGPSQFDHEIGTWKVDKILTELDHA